MVLRRPVTRTRRDRTWLTRPFARWFAGFLLLHVSCSAASRQSGNPLPARIERPASSPSQPTFDRVLLLESTSETSANVSIGDVNGDGNLDLVLAKGRHWPLVDRVLLGDGRGHILAAYDLGDAADRSYSGRLADLDGDGDLDVVISNDAPDPKLIYLNDGKGRFHVGSTYGRPEWETRNASVADLNGDGRPDIVVANRSDKGANYVCLNDGNGRFEGACVAFSQEPATTITPADFNRDGLIDLAVPHRDGGQSYAYLNGGNASFSSLRRVPFGPPDAAIRMVEAADLDRDGLLDIVAIDERRGVAVYFGQTDGTYSSGSAVDEAKVEPYALAVSDLNGDGWVDIIVGYVEAPSAIYFNRGSRSYDAVVRFGDGKGAVYGFAIADLDRDGLPDIAVARSDAPNVVYFGRSGGR
jgi:FG-GAP-like repeat